MSIKVSKFLVAETDGFNVYQSLSEVSSFFFHQFVDSQDMLKPGTRAFPGLLLKLQA